MSNKACAIKLCPHSKPKNILSPVILFPIPKDLYYQKLWLKASGRRLGKPDKFAVCQLHFGKEDFEVQDGQTTLKSNAVPSINLPHKEEDEEDLIIPPTDFEITKERYNLLLLEYELLEERVNRQEETLIALKIENSSLNSLLSDGA